MARWRSGVPADCRDGPEGGGARGVGSVLDVAVAARLDSKRLLDVAFSRFFKARTGKTFVDTLNEIRLGHASRMLIDTTQSIGEVAYRCGFNNMSNFNRIFKKKKDCTPKEFR